MADAHSFSDDAYWIWGTQEEDDTAAHNSTNSWMLFRKTIELTNNSSTSHHYFWKGKIAADSKYWLWMSEKNECTSQDDETILSLAIDDDTLMVREGGLKRGPTPNDTWYDPVDVQVLKQECSSNSSNTTQISIQVLVWYWGKNGFSHKDSGQGGLLLDGILLHNNRAVAKVVSDSSWRVQPHPAFVPHPNEAPPLDKLTPNYRLSEHNIYYDAQKEEKLSSKYNWQPAKTLGKAGSPPWNQLLQRTIPQFKYYTPINYKQVDYNFENNSTIVIQARLFNNTQFLPSIEFASPKTPAGFRVEIQTDNYQLGTLSKKKPNPAYLRATYITRSGRQRFESPAWINGHVVTYRIHHPPQLQLKVRDSIQVQYRPTRYPTRLVGRFHTNDDFYNRLWDKARRTLLVNMRDNFMDCPDRERAQWWGDLTVDIHQVGYCMDHRAQTLVQKAIFDLTHWQKKSTAGCPKLHSPVPAGATDAELPAQMLASIGWYGIWAYYQNTGDSATIQQAYPHVVSYLRDCWSLNATTGLVNHRRGDWDWQDWGENADAAIMDNAWYALALRAAIPMAKMAGHMTDVELWKQQLASIEANFDATFWNHAENAYMSPAQRQQNRPPDDRANALAVLADLVPTSHGHQSRWPGIAKVLTNQYWASPYMEFYVLCALFKMRKSDAALTRMKSRYNDMVAATNITTLWERWDLSTGTYNHAWSGGPLTVLSKYVAGIAPTSPGWKTFHVLPQDGRDLTHINTTVPVFLKGKDDVIKVSIEKIKLDMECLYKIELAVPAAAMATVGVPKSIKFTGKHCLLNTMSIDDVTVWTLGSGVSPESDSHLFFYGDAGDYIRWNTPPGSWRFEGRGNCGSTLEAVA